MLPYAFKVVWFTATLLGTILSCTGLIALGQCLEIHWAAWGLSLSLVALEGMVCLGFIWDMDPFKMPRKFCVAQSVIIHCASYVLIGFVVALFIAATEHILKPKRWAKIQTAFRWRTGYIIPVVLYPAGMAAIQLSLVFTHNAIQPVEGLYCAPSDPLWTRLTGEILPLSVLIPLAYLAGISFRAARRTIAHVNRAQKDENEIRRRMRREHERVAAVAAVAQLDPRNSTPSSLASSSFPTFAAFSQIESKPGQEEVDVSLVGEDSTAPTSQTGHERNDSQAELTDGLNTIKDGNDEEIDDVGTFRLSYRGSSTTPNPPSRVSHVAHIPTQTSTIYYLITMQICIPLGLFMQSISTIHDIATHRKTPSPFGTADIVMLGTPWSFALTTLGLPMVRRYIWRHYVPRWLRGGYSDAASELG